MWPSPEVEPVLLSETPPLREMPAFWSKSEPVALRSAMEELCMPDDELFIPPVLEEFVAVVDILFPVMFVPVVGVFIPC